MKTAIITGASTGIGKSVARHFLEKGYKVLINSANAENLEATYRELSKLGPIEQLAGDVGNPETGKRLVSKAVERFGSVDVLVNNAGVFEPQPFLSVQEKDLDRFLGINLKGTFFTSQAAVAQMLNQQGGVVVNIGTVLVDHAIDGFPATAPISSKGGIHALTKQLAAEFARNNIRVNAIAPGVIRTPLQSKTGLENADSLGGLHLLNRIGESQDVAELAYYIAESSFLTGEIINLDGGHAAGHRFN